MTVWMRRRDELDYLVEPDLFHDFFGHLPMLAHTRVRKLHPGLWRHRRPRQRTRGLEDAGAVVLVHGRFGMVATSRGLRAYGAGILSSSGETIYATKGTGPARIAFDLQRVLRTNYQIDSYQKTYFVLDDIEQLFDSVLAADFETIFAQPTQPEYAADARLPTDQPIASLAAS